MKDTLRHIAERASRGLVFKRSLPAFVGGGPIFVSPEAGGLRYYRGDLSKADPALLSTAHRFAKPGSVVWDIGANVGLFSFSCAGLVGSTGRVVAIEADTWVVGILRRSALLTYPGRATVDVVPAALSDTVGIAQFEIANRARSNNYLQGQGTTQTGGCRQVQQVVSVTLDWLLQQFPGPNVVKIDVEGAETLVLQGGIETLSKFKPVVLCEVGGNNVDSVTEILHSCNYELFDMDLPEKDQIPMRRATWNTLAIAKH